MRVIAIALGTAIMATTPAAAEYLVREVGSNTHMMMDRNSDDIAKLVNDWIEKQGLVN
jgi:hypothetical protein